MNTQAAAIDKHRLAGLQDGVYSIAMTLLVLELRLPALPEPLTDGVLWSALWSLGPKLISWLLSFWVLAILWIGDVRTLAITHFVDALLLRLSLCRLALVSLLPFSTAFIGEHGRYRAGAALYSAHLFLLAAAQVARYTYLRRNPDVATWPSPGAMKSSGIQAWAILLCSALAFGLAFLAPRYCTLALLPMLFLKSAPKAASR